MAKGTLSTRFPPLSLRCFAKLRLRGAFSLTLRAAAEGEISRLRGPAGPLDVAACELKVGCEVPAARCAARFLVPALVIVGFLLVVFEIWLIAVCGLQTAGWRSAGASGE